MENEKILTPTLTKWIRKTINYGEFLQGNPFKWNPIKNVPEMVTSKRRLLIWKASVVISMAYYAFVVGRFLQITLYGENEDIVEQVYMSMITVYYTFIPFFHLNVILKRHEFPVYLENTWAFIRNCEGRFVQNDGGSKPPMITFSEWVTKFLYITLNLDLVMIVVESIIRPNSREFLSSIFLEFMEVETNEAADAEESEMHLVQLMLKTSIIIASSTFQTWLMHTFMSQGLFICITMNSSISLQLALLDELSDNNKCRITSCELREPLVKLRMWRALEICACETDKMYSITIVCLKVLLIPFSVFCAFGAITYKGVMSVGLGINGASTAAFLALTFSVLCQVHERSSGLLMEWQRNGLRSTDQTGGARMKVRVRGQNRYMTAPEEALILKKNMRSLKCFSLNIAGMYYVDKGMVFTMFRFIAESTVNFILMYR